MQRPIQNDQISHLNEILQGTPYKPVSKLSFGSYGQIFKIEDQDGKEYVLKVVSKQKMGKENKLHEAIIEGFVLSKLNHPGVIKYYQTIQTKEHICQVEQFCYFGDLFGVLKKVNRNMELALLKQHILFFYLCQILCSMSYIHSKDLIHRDIKLQNIVVGMDMNSRLIDFGTAKPIKMQDFYTPQQVEFIQKLRSEPEKQQQMISRKSFVGSANYLSPQSISLQYSQASDVWSFGILVYRMFHNKLPFQGQNNYEIFTKIRQNQLNINQKLAPQVKQLIKACLNIEPSQRPTANQLQTYSYFRGVDFNQWCFNQICPLDKDILMKMYIQPEKQNRGSTIQKKSIDFYEVTLEKKMFFGNFKPRILRVYQRGQGLFMSYWYLDGTAPKNQFQLGINDYAQVISKSQFDVINHKQKYTFKVKKQQKVQQVVQNINLIIRKHYQL